MNIKNFRKKIKPNVKLIVNNKELIVREVIKFRFDDGSYYIKCLLNEDYVFADDEENNFFLLVKQVETPFKPPFPKKLNFQGKKFEFLYTAHAVAEEIWGKEIFKKGDSERFWDYKAEDDSYLSLGINDSSKQRLDFYGKIIKIDEVDVKS